MSTEVACCKCGADSGISVKDFLYLRQYNRNILPLCRVCGHRRGQQLAYQEYLRRKHGYGSRVEYSESVKFHHR